MPKNDHCIKTCVDSSTYLALINLAKNDDRSLSEYLRHQLKNHIKSVAEKEKNGMVCLGDDVLNSGQDVSAERKSTIVESLRNR